MKKLMKSLKTIQKNKKKEAREVTFLLNEEAHIIQIKESIPTEDKKAIVDIVVEKAFIEDDQTGLHVVDYLIADTLRDYLLVSYYTNIPVADDLFETMELLRAGGVCDVLFGEEGISQDEVAEIQEYIELHIEERRLMLDKANSLGNRIVKFIDGIGASAGESLEVLKDFDFDKLEVLKDLVGLKEESKAATK